MKTMRFASLVLALVLLLGLASCGGKEGGPQSTVLDYQSIQLGEGGTILTLGMSKKSIEALIGQPKEKIKKDFYSYLDGNIAIFYKSGLAIELDILGNLEEYKMLNFDPSMDESQIMAYYTDKRDYDDTVYYRAYCDQEGNPVDQENAYTQATIEFSEGELSSIFVYYAQEY